MLTSIKVIVYDDQVLLEQTSLADGVAPGRELTSIVHLDLNDHASQALVYNPASAIYNKFIALPQPHQEDYSARLSSNYCRLALGSRNAHFSVAIPFYSTHKTIAERGRCHWKYLALGIASLPRSNATVACLLRSEAQCRSFQCNHQPNLDRGRRFDRWTVMARLLGYRWSNDSLAGVTATSPQGKRLAIACWKEINVWPLNPEVIIEGPAGKDWEYYPDDAKRRHGQVRIPPVVLKPDAVVFSMCFSRDEDELIALTDKGVMRWALGPANHGFKVKKMLDMGEKSNMDEHETGKLEDTDMTDVE